MKTIIFIATTATNWRNVKSKKIKHSRPTSGKEEK